MCVIHIHDVTSEYARARLDVQGLRRALPFGRLAGVIGRLSAPRPGPLSGGALRVTPRPPFLRLLRRMHKSVVSGGRGDQLVSEEEARGQTRRTPGWGWRGRGGCFSDFVEELRYTRRVIAIKRDLIMSRNDQLFGLKSNRSVLRSIALSLRMFGVNRPRGGCFISLFLFFFLFFWLNKQADTKCEEKCSIDAIFILWRFSIKSNNHSIRQCTETAGNRLNVMLFIFIIIFF